MSNYYEMEVEIEGLGLVGIYADNEDDAHELARECDTSDIEVRDLTVTAPRILKVEKATG